MTYACHSISSGVSCFKHALLGLWGYKWRKIAHPSAPSCICRTRPSSAPLPPRERWASIPRVLYLAPDLRGGCPSKCFSFPGGVVGLPRQATLEAGWNQFSQRPREVCRIRCPQGRRQMPSSRCDGFVSLESHLSRADHASLGATDWVQRQLEQRGATIPLQDARTLIAAAVPTWWPRLRNEPFTPLPGISTPYVLTSEVCWRLINVLSQSKARCKPIFATREVPAHP
jgi:hypothetical protein